MLCKQIAATKEKPVQNFIMLTVFTQKRTLDTQCDKLKITDGRTK